MIYSGPVFRPVRDKMDNCVQDIFGKGYRQWGTKMNLATYGHPLNTFVGNETKDWNKDTPLMLDYIVKGINSHCDIRGLTIMKSCIRIKWINFILSLNFSCYLLR